MEVEDVLKNALTARVRQVKNNPNLKLDFENGKLNQHVATDDQARAVVLDATSSAANSFKRVLNKTGVQLVRSTISVNSGYGSAITVMKKAVANGTNPQVPIG